MNRIIITSLLTVIVMLCCISAVFWLRYKNITAAPPDKIEILSSRLAGTGKLILAEEKVYQEYIKKFVRGPAKAKVLFRWLTTFQYMIDMQNPQFKIVRDGNNLKVTSPPIQLNEPSIDISSYKPGIVFEGSIWINEQKLISDEMQSFKNISLKAGKQLMQNPEVVRLCTDQVKLAVLKIASAMQLQVDEVEIVFSAD